MEAKSKTAKKREMSALQKLGERLPELPHEQLDEIGIPPELQDALLLLRHLQSRTARRRQMQYIGVLMRRIDPEPLRRKINEIDKGQVCKAREFQQLELLRDGLIEGDDTVYAEVISRFPEANIRRIRQFARGAQKEKRENKPPKQSRSLFRYLRELTAKS
jgi:ribosome-associated protein